MSCSRPPPPPPAPPNPWAGRTHPGTNVELITGENWPHRLLHVGTMTSHVRQGKNTYNGVSEPRYNVLSYTWGFFVDQSATATPLPVHGINWPIPRIKPDHFSANTFRRAIEYVALGCKRPPCDWVWVDIACIPQAHPGEGPEAIEIRGQEIGRQVEIFKRAEEAFAWLSSLRLDNLFESKQKLTTFLDIVVCVNEGDVGLTSPNDLLRHWSEVGRLSRSYEQWMRRILDHPWLQSLWTLQEMVLRPDALILFDDGLLDLYPGDSGSSKQISPWAFMQIKNDIDELRGFNVPGGFFHHATLRYDECKSLPASQAGIEAESKTRALISTIEERIISLIALQDERGLSVLASWFPHSAYSVAQRRRVGRVEDRIYGIVQIYGISCDPSPLGADEFARLRALEDEFGTKLVSIAPLLSQIFIHSDEDERPRKSWLITQKCKADDFLWSSFMNPSQVVKSLFDRFEVLPTICNNGERTIGINFEVKAWNLRDFAESSLPSSGLRTFDRDLLFRKHSGRHLDRYRGMMLDRHVSKIVLGRAVDYFPSHDQFMDAVDRLEKYYGNTIDDGKDRKLVIDKSFSTLKVALLGSSSPPNLPVVQFVGLVVARYRRKRRIQTANRGKDESAGGSPGSPSRVVWERIGLMRWTECYGDNKPVHYLLPAHHMLSGIII
ncbi:hypothetical protein F5B21DRAFT_476434 [Xylaria acuta]|nr:hypothetical protein F5B21DRAFT_476434 [Xylaria acuta]